MTQRLRCNTCRGEYDDTSADGIAYFHVCPPVVLVRARFDDGTIGTSPLRAYRGLTIAPDQAAKDALVAGGTPGVDIVVELARRTAPRLDARDENTLRRDGKAGELRVLKAEGTGTTAIAPAPAPPAPVADAP